MRAPTKKHGRDQLLDIVECFEPIGAHMWEAVTENFSMCIKANFHQARNQKSLKKNFNKMFNAEKTIGIPFLSNIYTTC